MSKQTIQHLRKAASKSELQWVLFAPGPGSPLLFLVVVTDLQAWVQCSPVSLVSFITSPPESASRWAQSSLLRPCSAEVSDMADSLPCPGCECNASLDMDHGSKGMALIASQAQDNEICPMVRCVCVAVWMDIPALDSLVRHLNSQR